MARSVNSSKELGNMSAYRLEYEEALKDCKGAGMVFTHEKSGARVCVISNEDDNKVFYIGFRTPPFDSTGVAHIVEHTVLCGSKNFPAKDPFIELAKGSLNTFLNAMTYPDKTVYPVASCNEKDFSNLIHVYMDAVLYPNIYQREEIFKQEGWHYELESEDAPLGLNGIVYSEMKGAFSSPEQQLFREIQQSLFPDTAYGVESGGDPDVIPDLTYEAYLDFHKRYYHPANSYIYLYGDMDIEEKLNWLDGEYLSKFDKITVDSEIKRQKDLGMREIESFYSIGEDEESRGKTYLTYNTLLGDVFNIKQCMAFQILETVLLSAPGAPLKQALIEAGIGGDVISSCETEFLQPMLTVIAKDTDKEKKDAFLSVIKDTLSHIVKNGLNKNSLRAAINIAEFKYREADFGRFPKGLMYGLQILGSWLYDDKKVFSYMHGNDMFAQLKAEIDTGYFEGLIKEYLLDAKHVTILTLSPERGRTTKREEELARKLAAFKAGLSKAEIEGLVEGTRKLKEYQEEPSSKEDVEKIPLLARGDIKKQAEQLYVKEEDVCGIPALFHEVDTNGIAYVKCLFEAGAVPKEKLSYVGLLANVFGYINTKKHSFLELANEVNIHTGGINASVSLINRKGVPNSYLPVFMVSTKALYEELSFAFEFIREMICDALLDDGKRLLEILMEVKSRLQMKLNSSGHVAAAERACSYFSQSAYFEELTGGIDYYKFICELTADFEDKKTEIINSLIQVNGCIFAKGNLLLSVTAEEDGYKKAAGEFSKLYDALADGGSNNFFEAKKSGSAANWRGCAYDFDTKKKNEGFGFSGQVQYVACAGNYISKGFAPTGALKVLRTIMSYDYLWNNVRVKGGAYGCGCSLAAVDGTAYFSSYRDPNLSETKQVYSNARDYIKRFRADEREMTKYIIGTMSTVDTPLTPVMKGSRSLNAFLSGVNYNDIQKDRDEILNANEESIRKTADIVGAVVEQDNFCVIGNEKKLKENRELFMEIKPLY